jgi:hypothetical protein
LVKESYLKETNKILEDFREKIFTSSDQLNLAIKHCLQVLTSKEYKEVISLLGNGPVPLKKVKAALDLEMLKNSTINDIIYYFQIDGVEYASLVYHIHLQYFQPKYIINKIVHNLKNKKISNEMALTHLDLLSESETELKIIKKH